MTYNNNSCSFSSSPAFFRDNESPSLFPFQELPSLYKLFARAAEQSQDHYDPLSSHSPPLFMTFSSINDSGNTHSRSLADTLDAALEGTLDFGQDFENGSDLSVFSSPLGPLTFSSFPPPPPPSSPPPSSPPSQ